MEMNQQEESYWSGRWTEGQTGWDIGYASPALIEYAKIHVPKDAKVLIPGAGNGYEVQFLFQNGWHGVHALDIAVQPLQKLKERCPEIPQEQLIRGDFFQFEDQFDFILEQTFFCSFDPELRPAYIEKMHGLLRPGGHLAGLLFDIPLDMKGRPYGGTQEEYKTLLATKFELISMGPALNSIPPRTGSELFFEAKAN